MPDRPVSAPFRGAPVLIGAAQHRRTSSARLLPVATAFARFAPDLARLCRMSDPAVAMTFSPAWWRAIPPPRGYAHRLLLLHRHGELRAAVSLRERTVLGIPTGILHAADAKGEGFVLASPGTEAEWLAESIEALFRSRRCIALLLTRLKATGSVGPAAPDAGVIASIVEEHKLEHRTQVAPLFWQTALCPVFDQILAPLGHRTRRNLRHALRRVRQNGWHFLPELTSAEVSEATTALATRSTHPYSRKAIAARLELESTQERSFSMGLQSERGEWLSLLTGVRRPEGVTDVFWQSNAAAAHDSVAMSMRALLMRFEGERGSSLLRWIGGTSPLLEHCCRPDPGIQTLITRPGLRLSLLQRLLQTRLASSTNPMQKLLRLAPSGA